MPVAVSNPITSIWKNRIKHHQNKLTTLPRIESASTSTASSSRDQRATTKHNHTTLRTGQLKEKVNVLPNIHCVNTTWNNDTKSKNTSKNNAPLAKKSTTRQATFKDQPSRASRASGNKSGMVAKHSSCTASLKPSVNNIRRATFNRQKRKSSAVPTSYSAIQKSLGRVVSRLMDIFPLEEELIRNVIAYTQMLPKLDRLCIDMTVFKALLMDRFSMTNAHVAMNLFRALVDRKVSWAHAGNKCANDKQLNDRDNEGFIDVETCASFFCILLAEDTTLQAQLVFNVFDFNRSESMDKAALKYVMAPMFGDAGSRPLHVFNAHGETDQAENEEDQQFMINLVFNKMDIDGNGTIDRNEFVTMCEDDKHMLAFFGPLLPQSDSVERFREILQNKTPFVIKAEYKHERQRLLRELRPNTSYIQSLYPIELDGL